MEEAELLASSYAERSATGQMPIDVQHQQLQLLPAKDLRIQHTKLREDATDCSFLIIELRRARKGSRDIAPGDDGITHTMLRKMVVTGEATFLSLINASCFFVFFTCCS